MILQLKYFGMIAEAIERNEESFNFTGKSLEDLNALLRNTHQKLAPLNYSFAVNQTIADKSLLLKENDEIALLPPFAGG